MQGTTWQNEFLVDTVLMSNDDQNPETGASDWIEDVVNRALKVLTDLTRRLLPKKRTKKQLKSNRILRNPQIRMYVTPTR